MQLDRLWEQVQALDPMPLLLAVVLGGIVGLERQIHGRPAGLRTHILVCLASTMLIYVSRHLPVGLTQTVPAAPIVLDPTRLAAGIVTGVGFLGAASVIRAGDMVRGITTGACIWAVSGLGIVIGYGSYGLAVAGAGGIVMVLVVLDWLEGWIKPVIYRRLVLRGRVTKASVLVASVRALLKKRHVRVQDLTGWVEGPDDPYELVFSVRCRNHLYAAEMLEAIGALEGVTRAEWK